MNIVLEPSNMRKIAYKLREESEDLYLFFMCMYQTGYTGETILRLKTYNLEEARNIGIQELEQELDGEIEDKTKIVNKNINTYEIEEGVDVYVTYEVLENIGTNEKIVFWRC